MFFFGEEIGCEKHSGVMDDDNVELILEYDTKVCTADIGYLRCAAVK